jgi:predicted NBD/HSP70 family sugar kinase
VRTDEAQRAIEDLSGTGSILSLIASGAAQSRTELQARTGLSRTTIAQRLGALLSAALVQEADETMPSGGRPARVLRLNANVGVLLVADVGETVARLAITDLEPKVLIETTVEVELRTGPLPVLEQMAKRFVALLAEIGRPRRDVFGVGLSLPAPVDFAAGRVFGPSIMIGWDDFDIRGWLEAAIGAPVFAENDVNVMTLFELRRYWPAVAQLLFIKAGTGIGAGIVTDGRIYRGAQGAAGDIGHIQLNSDHSPQCRCGKLGCVEARAAGWALARDLRAAGFAADNARDVVALVQAGQPEAIRRVREAGRVLGEVAADVVSVLNPAVIVVGGTLASVDEHLLSGIRQVVFERSLPLATRELRIVRARSGAQGGVLGAAQLAIDSLMAPETIERTIANYAQSRLALSAALGHHG